ncbi:cupin domain-containing protein [Geodermatophilaceae bacterium NBWT11]|nr:cupin domain-containing protein [Geodermatophilaceae bacterium NBWT11]
MTDTAPVTTARDRLLSDDVGTHPLADLPLDPTSIVAGRPRAGLVELGTVGGATVGVWELGEGTVTDTETDEVFVVVAGRGSVAFADGSTLDLSPGVVVRLHAGDTTTWVVTEALRKVWLA